MPPDRFLEDTLAGESPPPAASVQQIIEAEHGRGTTGINRRWLASNSNLPVLTSDASGVKISQNNGVTPPASVIVQGSPAGGSLNGTYPNPGLTAEAIDAFLPPGLIMAWGHPTQPNGWLECNGGQVSRTLYAKLFAAIGTTWGAGDGSTTFNLPNLRGRMLLGAGGAWAFGTVGGFPTAAGPAHTHPGTHNHGMNGHTHGPGSHTHGPGSHTHAQGSHSHGMTHGHTMDHTHVVNLDHDHANASAAAAASGSTLNGRFTAGGVNALPDAHTHDVNLPALGLTNTTSGGTATGTADAPASGVTAPPSAGAADSGPPSASNTAGPTANATDAATGTTADSTAAPDAAYGGVTIPTLPPYAVAMWIIRSG
jgi:microcystin-dependent protein